MTLCFMHFAFVRYIYIYIYILAMLNISFFLYGIFISPILICEVGSNELYSILRCNERIRTPIEFSFKYRSYIFFFYS